MALAVKAIFLVVGLIHFLPVIGVLSASRLEGLYGVQATDPNLIVLLRHRAVLLGIPGVLLVVAAFVPGLQILAAALGLISMLSFTLVARSHEPLHPRIRRVSQIDLFASVLLAVGVLLGLAI
jgi:hypothetical protein